MKRISMSGLYTARRSAQGYLCASEETPATAVLAVRHVEQETRNRNRNRQPAAQLAEREISKKREAD